MANNLNLGVDEGDLEELLEVVPEELTNEVLLQLEQEHTAEEEAREWETGGEENKAPIPKKIHRKAFSRGFCRLQQAP